MDFSVSTRATQESCRTSQRPFEYGGNQKEPVGTLSIPQKGIDEQVCDVGDEVAKHANPQGANAALAIRKLQPRTQCPCQILRKTGREDKLTDPQYAVVKQLRIPVAVVITFRIEGVRLRRSHKCLWEHLRVRNSAEAACTTGSALQSLVSSLSDAKRPILGSAPALSEYSGRRVLHTRWVIACTFGAAVVVEAANTKGIVHRNLCTIKGLGLYTMSRDRGEHIKSVPEC